MRKFNYQHIYITSIYTLPAYIHYQHIYHIYNESGRFHNQPLSSVFHNTFSN